MHPSPQTIIDQLEETRQRWWIFSLLCNVVFVATVSLATLALFILADAWLQLSRTGLLILLMIWCGVSLAVLGAAVVRVARNQRCLAATARRVELAFPELGSHLINVVQFSKSAGGSPDHFRQAALAEATWHASRIVFPAAAQRQSRWGRWKLGLQTPRDLAELAGALLGVIAVFWLLSLAVPTWSSAADRLFAPWRFVPRVGAVEIVEVTPGDTEVLRGSRLEIAARVADPGRRKLPATLYLTPDGDEESAQAMLVDPAGDLFTWSVPAILQPFDYRLQIGDSQTRLYHVGVRDVPTAGELEITYQYPQYMRRSPRTVHQLHGDLEAPQYTKVRLRIHCATTIAKGYLQLAGRRLIGTVSPDRSTLSVALGLSESTDYTIHLYNELGQTDPQPRVNRVQVVADTPPTVQLLKPAHDTTIAVGGDLPVAVRASDDYGLREVRVEWKLASERESSPAEAAQCLQIWPQSTAATAATVAEAVPTEALGFTAGQAVLIRAVAVDRRHISSGDKPLGPQETASPWRRIRVIAEQEAAAESLARLEGFHARLWAILQTQIRARLGTSQWARSDTLEAAVPLVQSVLGKQVQVQRATQQLADETDAAAGDADRAAKRTLGQLARDEMLLAVSQTESAAREDELTGLVSHVPPLSRTQDAIIAVLRKLLDRNRQAISERLAEWKDRPGGDMPSDVQEKLEMLNERLHELTKQQRRVIEATENLAKKPVEDFTQQDEQLLRELAASEDDWSRFLAETHSDLSKLPQQDFANPSLLEELVEVQTEIQMAADALTKKSLDIAVPLEQLGAEMAEQLTTNLEKWLPDTPDRERWSQEEPLSDAMKEAPMAELPGELEDLVGHLMEQEEDLLDEMEDVSSSWADSIDKGAGWDAADGPISNMSAKGVTGNRLPNTSEIGGRSGEGRQGKSSGEFVSDTAVGKGGRKTPSRLAPDPFVQGQVKDFSQDPTGGATGGGKESGVGGEGLEGPVSNSPQRQLRRMADRQADLRNRAESIELKFQVLDYHPTDLRQLIQAMAAVERDLRSGRYRSALRRREMLLEGLGALKTYVQGEFQVRRDESASLPADVQKELLGGMRDESPAGWEELNRQYFRRLNRE
jgi:hypothetical protein